jgi:hypothetical protein
MKVKRIGFRVRKWNVSQPPSGFLKLDNLFFLKTDNNNKIIKD